MGNNKIQCYRCEEGELFITELTRSQMKKERFFENHEQDEKDVTGLAEELGIDKSDIWDRIYQELNCDLGDEHIVIQNVLKKIREERNDL